MPRRAAAFASPSAILLGSLAFGILFLLAWQFLPPALGVPSYIIPTVTDLAREFGRMVARENLLVHIFSTVTIATVGFVIGSLLGAAMGYVLGMSVLHREGALALHPRSADRAQGRLCAALHHVARLQRLAEADGHHPGGVLSDPGERAAVDEDGRPRPDQSRARLQHEPHADLLEDRGAGIDAGADGGTAHRRHAWR